MRNTDFLTYSPEYSTSELLPPRDLDGLTRLCIQEMLCAFPQPKQIRVVAVFGERENVVYAQQILDYLEESGWNTGAVVEIVAQSVLHIGVYIRMGLHDTSVIEVVVGSNG